jgi:hypothetical protein
MAGQFLKESRRERPTALPSTGSVHVDETEAAMSIEDRRTTGLGHLRHVMDPIPVAVQIGESQ